MHSPTPTGPTTRMILLKPVLTLFISAITPSVEAPRNRELLPLLQSLNYDGFVLSYLNLASLFFINQWFIMTMLGPKICVNPVFHSRLKHVALDYHFICEQVQNGLLKVSHVIASDQLADVLTKPLSRQQFTMVVNKIGLTPPPSILRGSWEEYIMITSQSSIFIYL